MDLECLAGRFVTSQQLLADVRFPGRSQQSGQPILVTDDAVERLAGLELARPAGEDGTRKAPSQLVFFSLRQGVMPASGQVL